MRKSRKNYGFSLTEVLLSVGILAMGMTFIAGVFPVAIHFTTIATERTIAAIAADEAFAKIRIYAIGDLNEPINFGALGESGLAYDFNDIFPAIDNIDPNINEFAYPSTGAQGQYYWSALFRRTDDASTNVQVTVFVSRRVSPNVEYPAPPDGMGADTVDWPMPVRVGVSQGDELYELEIDRTFIKDGYTIVDDATGRIYRVLERYPPPDENTILLDRNWDEDSPDPEAVWVVPPPVGSGRYPCIAIYQKVIRF